VARVQGNPVASRQFVQDYRAKAAAADFER
jgi:hypothetical protein